MLKTQTFYKTTAILAFYQGEISDTQTSKLVECLPGTILLVLERHQSLDPKLTFYDSTLRRKLWHVEEAIITFYYEEIT